MILTQAGRTTFIVFFADIVLAFYLKRDFTADPLHEWLCYLKHVAKTT